MLMDTLQMKSLDGIEIPKAKFVRAKPDGLPKLLPHLPRLHNIHTTKHHHENSETPEKSSLSSPQEQLSEGISPIFSSTVLADISKLNSSMSNIPMSPIPIQYSLSRSPPSPSIAATASPMTVQHHTCPSLQPSLYFPSTIHHFCLYRNHPLW